MCSLGYLCMYDFTGKYAVSDEARIKIYLSLFVKIHTFSNAYDLLCFTVMMCLCASGCILSLCSCSGLSPSLPRSCLVTMQPGQNNMDTTVAEWPFWVKARCNNKQLLALRSCFPAADRCQNTELTGIPFTAVEKHQPSKPTYLLRLWTACNPSAARWLSETRQLRLLPKKLLRSYGVTFV